jgi:signal peptidase I
MGSVDGHRPDPRPPAVAVGAAVRCIARLVTAISDRRGGEPTTTRSGCARVLERAGFALAGLATAGCVVVIQQPAPVATHPEATPVNWDLLCGAGTPTVPYYRVGQQSMEDTILPGDVLLLDRPSVQTAPYKRGDIVVFAPPSASASSVLFIKRVIGLPGDTVDLRGGHVFINGQEISEPYVYPGQMTEPIGDQNHWVVPLGSLFVLGDHRESSMDSRVFGPIGESSVEARAVYRCYPTGRRGPLR